MVNTTKSKPPRLPFLRMKEKVLGEKYNLSLAFIGSARSKNLNQIYRGKDKPANVLSFPYDKHEGEIFIDLREAKKQAPLFGKDLKKFVALLFIHGMFHLKGYDHGGKMERLEKKNLDFFKLS